jgi:hypothetical protein
MMMTAIIVSAASHETKIIKAFNLLSQLHDIVVHGAHLCGISLWRPRKIFQIIWREIVEQVKRSVGHMTFDAGPHQQQLPQTAFGMARKNY